MKKLNFQEQAFMALYLKSYNATHAALGAGYSESVAKNHAWCWVSVTGCPENKRHLRDAIRDEIDRRFGIEEIDADWVLKRAKLLADFNISTFIRMEGAEAVYDFSTASADDWYCIEEYITEQIFRRVAGGKTVPVDKLKIKTVSKVAALKLIGDHTKVQAFRDKQQASAEEFAEVLNKVIDKLPG